MDHGRPPGIIVVALLMIVFGCVEVVTAFTHNFFGLHITPGEPSAYVGATLGVLYAAAGVLILSMRRRAGSMAVGCLIVIVVGRILMTVAGLYPVTSIRQVLAMAGGTSIAAGFAVYIGMKRSAFT
jgi:drug/metabolite transporter (DMT)-like permease